MTTIQRLSDSCLLVSGDDHATLFDPGFHPHESSAVDLDDLGDVTRILISHEHRDHVSPDFVRWVLDRGTDVAVHANQAVADLLAPHDIEVETSHPGGVSAEDVIHEMIPTGAQPPNRAWTIDGLITHPGDSYQATTTAPVLALPLLTPWGSTTASVDFARRLGPAQVVPIHDFYLNEQGRSFVVGLATNVLAGDGIEVVPLDWGHSYTV